ncbi:hypothetical protein OTU49_008363 [Cherax quadricarinatus]|uniref:Uncharacterized protein n=1 Tax=Cherax quadricarinatus TaxID=27406 RepID=A0AAW0WRD2_CHEQU
MQNHSIFFSISHSSPLSPSRSLSILYPSSPKPKTDGENPVLSEKCVLVPQKHRLSLRFLWVPLADHLQFILNHRQYFWILIVQFPTGTSDLSISWIRFHLSAYSMDFRYTS